MPAISSHRSGLKRTVAALACTLAAGTAAAQDRITSFGLYGAPGLMDTPTAEMAPDATLSTTFARMHETNRVTLSFQLTPRISGSFRYAALENFTNPGSIGGVYYDRSFDLRYQVLTEGRYRPAVTIGLQDFAGTGLYSSEYLVATKTIAPGLKLTGGLGWGRLGSSDAFATTGTRPTTTLGKGGIPSYNQWFRGDVSAFGGISYAPNDRLRLKAEYSSDAYVAEVAGSSFKRKSPWNYGLDYTLKSGHQLSLYHAYGDTYGVSMTFFTRLKDSPIPGSIDSAPLPVKPRSAAQRSDLGWTADSTITNKAYGSLSASLAKDGIALEGMELDGRSATVRVRNIRYGMTPQAIGRTARAMTRSLPGSVESFTIVPVVSGMALSAVEMRRSDVESLENEAAAEMLAKTRIVDGYRRAPGVTPGIYPRFTWSLGPDLNFSIFDPNSPIRANLNMRLQAAYELSPNLVLEGAVSKHVTGNLYKVSKPPVVAPTLPPVRTDYGKYANEGDPAIDSLTLSYYGRPGPNLFSRVSVGYLEMMYAGVSTEVLWKPVDSRLGLGVELNYVKKRDFDQMFGLQSYDAVTGYASAYYDFGNGFHGQLDVGRYLAGDYGATVSLDREFGNGWRVGAYATFTDASAEDFGEGSFDKGLRFTIPLSWPSGKSTRGASKITLQSLNRDGGSRLELNNRLYERVREYHEPQMTNTWGRFWR